MVQVLSHHYLDGRLLKRVNFELWPGIYHYADMDSTTIIGITASSFTGISLLPQLVKLVSEKKGSDISMWMMGALFTGLALFIWYGFRITDWVIVSANIISLLLNAAVVTMNLYYKHNEKAGHA